MKKASRKTPAKRSAGVDWSKATRNPYAGWLADRHWHVRLDADLVDLLTATGDPGERLLGLANRPKRRERLVMVIPMTDKEYKAAKPLLDRIGAIVEYVPPHPNAKLAERAEQPRRRKAG